MTEPRASSPLDLFRIGSIRFTAYYTTTFVLGLGVAGELTAGAALAAGPFWALYCLCTELINRIADRREDAVNRPERTALCERLGWPRVIRITIILWGALLVADTAWLVLSPSPQLALLLVYGAAVSAGYSFGPRMKRRPVLGQLVLTMPLVMPYLTGVAMAGEWSMLLSPGLPGAVLLMVLALALVGIKDVTDVEGDRLIGYRSLWIRLARANRRWRLVSAAAPMILVTALVAAGVAPPRLLWLWLLVPLSWATIVAAARAAEPRDGYAAREVMHTHLALTLAVVLAVTVPTLPALCCAVGAVAFWVVASNTLHWGPALSRDDLVRWRRLLGRMPEPNPREV